MLVITSTSSAFLMSILLVVVVIIINQQQYHSVFVSAQTTTTAAACTTTVDPYSGECLSSISDDDLLKPCDEATSLSKCGCKTCALPGCTGCISSGKQCDDSNGGGGGDDNSNSCECPAGFTTEYDQFQCGSFDPSTIATTFSSLSSSSGNNNDDDVLELTSTDLDILMSSGVVMSSKGTAAKVNAKKYFRQKTSRDEALSFILPSSSSSSNDVLVVALTWIPPIALISLCAFVLYYLISFA